MRGKGILASQFFLGQVEIPKSDGQVLLEEESRIYYDFTQMTGADETSIANGNAGLIDYSPGSSTATIGNTPVVDIVTVGANQLRGFKDFDTDYINTNNTFNTIFNSSFEIHTSFHMEDGVPPEEQALWALFTSNGRQFAEVDTTGKLTVSYKSHSAADEYRWKSTNQVFANGVGNYKVRLRFDFETDLLTVEVNGNNIVGTQISSGAGMSAQVPTSWTSTHNMVIGAFNNNGTVSGTNTSAITFFRWAVTDLLTTQQNTDVQNFLLEPTGTGPAAATPTIQATNLSAIEKQTSMILSWTNGNGSNKLVVGRQGSAVNAIPINGTSYTANTVFGSGSEIGTDNFVVYTGNSNTVTVTGLTRDTLYYWDVYEFNTNGLKYLTTIGTNTIESRTAYIYDESFTNYGTDYTKTGAGFTDTVSSGELLLVGDPAGWVNYISHDDFFPSNLEEFEIEVELRLNEAPDTTSYGLGIGIRNDTATEANRVVVAEYILNTNHPSDFGRSRIYAGNGTVSSPTAITLSGAASATAFTPVDESTYRIVFRRELIGNDAFYSVTITDLVTELQITSNYTETNRPSSAFFGTTMRAYIHQNGGSNAINNFIVRRIGDDSGLPPPPPVTYDVYVDAVNGNDGNDGSENFPRQSIEAGLARIAELGGSNRGLYISAGNYTLSSYASPPLNCGLISGAGKGVTNITGASNLRGQFSGSGGAGQALFNFSAASMSVHNITLRDMTLDGGNRSTVNGLANDICVRVGVYVNNRDGVVLENMEFRDFNIFGTWHRFSQNSSVSDSEYFNCGGNSVGDYVYPTASSTSTYITGAIGIGQITNHTISNVTVNNPGYGHGYPIKIYTALSNFWPTLTNFTVNGLTTNQHDRSPWTYQVGVTVANINTELNIAGAMNGVIFENCVYNQGFFSIMTREADPGISSVIIRNNIFRTNTFAWEIFCHNVEAYGNYVTGNGSLLEANGRVRGLWKLSSGFNSETKYPGITRTNITVRNNYIEIDGNSSLIECPTITMRNFVLRNNTIAAMSSGSGVTLSTSPPALSGGYKGPWTGLLIEDNAYEGPYNGNLFSVGGAGVSGTVRNNKATNHIVTQTISGITGGVGQNNTTNIPSLGFNKTGTKPIPFYALSGGSILIGAGFGGDNVGAYQ